MKSHYIRSFIIILLLAWMALIFFMSSREADESAQMSNAVGMEVGRIFVPHFTKWSPESQEAFAAKIDHPIRKSAHAGEYAVLGILWTVTLCMGTGMRSMNWKQRLHSVWYKAWILAALYAASDEFHQLFVAGRSGQLSDVILDSAGALAGIALAGVVAFRVSQERPSLTQR